MNLSRKFTVKRLGIALLASVITIAWLYLAFQMWVWFIRYATGQRGAVQQVVILSLGETAELDRLMKDYKTKEEAYMAADEAQHKYAQFLLESRGLRGEIDMPRSNIGSTTAGCNAPNQGTKDCGAYVWQPSADNKALILR